MLNHISEVQKASLFTCLALGITLLLSLLPIQLNTSVFMLVPLVAVLITMLLTGEMFSKDGWKSLGFHRFSAKLVFLSFLVPVVPMLLSYGVVWGTGMASVRVPAEYEDQMMFLVIGFFVTLIINAVTTILGEEIGWRGYLLPRLRSLGMTKALLLHGWIWGLFHLPVMIFTDLYHSNVNLFAYIPLFLLNVVLAGAFIGYVRIISDSIWPAIFAHTSHNLVWAYCQMLTADADPIVSYVAGDAGILLIVVYAIIFGWIVKYGQSSAVKQRRGSISYKA